MKKILSIAGIAALVAIVGVATLGAVVFAQDSDNGSGWPFDFRAKMHEAVANILGISADEYDAALDKAQDQVLGDAVTEGWLTQEQADLMQERMAEGVGPGMRGGFMGGPRGGGFGMMPGRGGFMGAEGDTPLSVAADKLGMSVDDLTAELQAGKTIADVAKEKGVDTQTIVDAYVAQVAEQIASSVSDGKITQQQADWMIEQAQTRIETMIENSMPCGGHGARPGRMQGFPGQSGA